LSNYHWDFPYGFPREQGDTVYLTTADEEGMMVSFIHSNYTDFGSRIVVPGTEISLQSRGACFSLKKNHIRWRTIDSQNKPGILWSFRS